MDMPQFSSGFEGEGNFEDSHVRLCTVSSEDLDRERNLGILPHLLEGFPAILESGYPIQTFLVRIAKNHRPLAARWLSLVAHPDVHRETIRSPCFGTISPN